MPRITSMENNIMEKRRNCWVNNREAGDLRRYRAHYDVIVMNFHDQRSVMRNVFLSNDILMMVIYHKSYH